MTEDWRDGCIKDFPDANDAARRNEPVRLACPFSDIVVLREVISCPVLDETARYE